MCEKYENPSNNIVNINIAVAELKNGQKEMVHYGLSTFYKFLFRLNAMKLNDLKKMLTC